MATIFVSSVDGNNADSGADWANAKQTVAGALAIAADGDVIKVDSAHNFSAGAAITWTPPAGNVAIISVNRASGDAWLAGAIESIGAVNGAFAVAGAAGSAMFVYGMTLNGATPNNALNEITLLSTINAASRLEMRSCTLVINTANTSAQIVFGMSNAGSSRSLEIILDSCVLQCAASRAGTLINWGEADVEIINPTFTMSGATKPAILFETVALGDTGRIKIRDGDASGYAVSGGAYFGVANFSASQVLCENLKLSSAPSIATGSWPGGVGSITLRNCDSGDTINTFEYRNAYGILAENASIYASGGASFNGAGVSWEITTTAACNEHLPFVLPPISIWNAVTSAQTATVEFVKDGATDLTDREIWLELSYAASASFPNYTAATDRNANPFTGSAVDQPNSSTSWTGTGGFANENKQTVDVAFTAAEVGLLEGRVSVAKASTTLYVDPKLRVA